MQYYKENRTANNGVFAPPTVLVFLTALWDLFKEVDEEGSSLTHLERIKQGGQTVEQHNTDFKLLARRLGITNQGTLINLYCQSISQKILEKIIAHNLRPRTLDKWMTKVVTLNKQWRIMMGILDKPTGQSMDSRANSGRMMFNFRQPQYQDPYAMDVDTLLSVKRKDWIRDKPCYNCGKMGHFVQDCKQPNQNDWRRETSKDHIVSKVG